MRLVIALILVCLPLYATNLREKVSECALHALEVDRLGGQEYIDAALVRRNIDPTKAKPIDQLYQICMDVPEKGICTGVTSPRRADALTRQIQEVALFLRDLHIDMFGAAIELFSFKEVVIAPRKEVGPLFRSMNFEGSRLVIGVPSYWGVGYRPVSARQIRRMWDAGEMFPRHSRLRRRWEFLNPAGAFRVGLRESVRHNARSVIKRIEELKAKVDDRADLTSKVAEVIGAESEETLPEKLRTASRERLLAFLNRWQEDLADPAHSEQLIDAGIFSGIFDDAPRNVRVRIFGLVAYGNFHGIEVKIRLGALKYVRVTREVGDIDITVVGLLFGGFTIDDVKVHIDLTHSVEKSTFDQALWSL